MTTFIIRWPEKW